MTAYAKIVKQKRKNQKKQKRKTRPYTNLIGQLRSWMRPVNSVFQWLNNYTLDADNALKRRVFIDRGGSVLFVAHLDTVHPPKIRGVHGYKICAQGLDDRLGCMLAYNLSEELGADLLLTDNEESCASTAYEHTAKDYNWIVEFDREGTDVVTYGLDNSEFRNALGKYWTIGIGAYSDICTLESKACAFNLGCGGYKSHKPSAYVDLRETAEQITLFHEFYAEYKDTKFVRTPGPRTFLGGFRFPDFRCSDDFWDDQEKMCELCGLSVGQVIHNDYCVCAECFQTLYDDYLFVR